MLLVDNITILKNVYPLTWEKLKAIDSNSSNSLINIELTKNGQKTLAINKDGKTTYLHSKYNPMREAETIIEDYKDIDEKDSIIFYGSGLGYHIDVFLKKYPNTNYYIYEPIPEILRAYLSSREIKDLPSRRLRNIFTGGDKKDISSFIDEIIDKATGETKIVRLPMHCTFFSENYKEFLDTFKEVAENKKSGIVTESAFQKRWTINSIKNFKEVLYTPNIILEKKGKFEGKTALLVSAGPSLNEEIENIRYIKEKGLAYIFSVGSSINTLIHHGIYPDAACTYDPTAGNHIVFKKLINMGILDIPMIFGSSVGYETLEKYHGKKAHMITSQDTIARFYLKAKGVEEIDGVFDAPSIAVITLQLLYQLSFSKIILVGQNLAFRDRKRHAEGIEYSEAVTESELKNGIWVQDVYGKEILTNDAFNRMKQQIEFYIKEFNMQNIINTTKGGALIDGTTFMDLKEVMNTYLNDKVVDKEWLDCSKTEYDKEHIISQSKKMDREQTEALKLVKRFHSILDSIRIFVKDRNFNQAERMYTKLDKVLSKIEKNLFFKVFILPMNRINYKTLVDSIDSLNEEKDKTIKGKLIEKTFRQFMNVCEEDIVNTEDIYKELKKVIYEFTAINQS